MGVLILSTEITCREKIISDIVIVAKRIGAKFQMEELKEVSADRDIDIYFQKHNDDIQEYFYIGVHPISDVKRTYDLLNFKIGKYYGIAGTDQEKYPNLIYSFGLEYLRINPNYVLSINGETFYSWSDFERMESEGGYFKDWCYYDLPWQKESIY